ncbi:MAG: transcriptional antiterminator NusG [Chitinophagales bacterium]|jgi:transcriptional antiterminator NusG
MSDDRKWYVLRVVSGKERKIKEYLDVDLARMGFDKVITQILVPTEKVYKISKGKKVIKERNLFPGYIYIEAIEKKFSGEIIQHISGTTNVINFLGGKRGSRKPEPLRQAEVFKLLGKVDDMADSDEVITEPYLINETVKIVDGPFNDFLGTIEEIFDEKKKLKLIVKIFGRRTPVEVNFIQVEKVS